MAEFVKFRLDDGSEVYFETAESNLVTQYAGERDVVDGGRLEGRLTGVALTAEQVSNSLRSRLTPDEVTLEFGVQVGGQVNWFFFAKNQAEATIKVTLKWSAAESASLASAKPPLRSVGAGESEPTADR